MKDQRAVLTLVAVLEDWLWGQPKRGYSPAQKQLLPEAAAQSLAQIGGPVARQKANSLLIKSATEALLKLARQHLGIAILVSDIARALGEIGDGRAVELLAILLKDHVSTSVRSQAALALGKIRSAKALAALKSRLSKEKGAGVKANITTAINGKPAVLQWKFP